MEKMSETAFVKRMLKAEKAKVKSDDDKIKIAEEIYGFQITVKQAKSKGWNIRLQKQYPGYLKNFGLPIYSANSSRHVAVEKIYKLALAQKGSKRNMKEHDNARKPYQVDTTSRQ